MTHNMASDQGLHCLLKDFHQKQEMLQYVTDAPKVPYATHLLIMLYLSVMFR